MKESPIKKILKIWKGTIVVGLLFAMIFFTVSAFIPPKYKATSSIAISQESTAGMDAYREAKSSEFIARNTKEIILSNSFMRGVLNQEDISWKKIDQIAAQDERIKFWRNRVKVSIIPNTGVMSISVYTDNKILSKTLTEKIINYLQKNEASFFSEKKAKISVINEPYYFSSPAFPNLIVNTIVGFIIGVLGVSTLVLLEKENVIFPSSKEVIMEQGQRKEFENQQSKKDQASFIKEKIIMSNDDGRAKLDQLIKTEGSEYASHQNHQRKPRKKEASSPANLPILEEAINESFEKNKKNPSAEEIALGYAPDKKDIQPTEKEIKERLNQLIKGEL